MTRSRSISGFLALGPLVAALLAGCAQGPSVQTDALPLKRVVIYRNGVGYFQRSGTVEAERVKFRVRGSEVGDFLATMAVIEQGGSSVKSASFPLKVEDPDQPEPPVGDEATVRPFLRPVGGGESDQKKQDPNALVNVLLDLDGKKHDLSVGYIAETPVWRPSYRLVIEKDAADLQAWGIVQNLSGEDWQDVALSLVAGAPLAFEATLGTPVIPTRPEVSDSGEVIGAMPGSETSLRAQTVPPPAPTMMPGTPAAEKSAAMDDEAAAPYPKPAAQRRATGSAAATRSKDKKKGAGPRNAPVKADYDGAPAGGGMAPAAAASAYGGYPMDAPAPPPPPPPVNPSGPRNLSALAAVALEGSSTRYDIPTKITVPDKSATMVMLVSKRVPGESGFLYAPAGGVPDSMSHPFRVARFTNQTGGLLERGPIAVFENGAFLGQGVVDPLPPGATTTVPFALERAIAVDTTTKSGEQGARIAKIEAGELTIERDLQIKTTYRVQNGGEDAAKIYVKHNRHGGMRLVDAPPGTDDNAATGTALFPAQAAAHATVEIVVDERSASPRVVDWLSPLADDAVKGFLADDRGDANVRKQLAAAWDIRPQLLKTLEEERKLQQEQSELSRDTEETRNNLKALEKNTAAAALRAQLTDRLAKSSARLNEITKRLVELSLAENEQRVRFYEAIRAIKLLSAPGPR